MGGSHAPLLEPQEWAIAAAATRIYAANGFAQGAIAAARTLQVVDNNAVVHLTLPAPLLEVAGDLNPQTDEEAWWSIPYAVAVTVLGFDLENRELLRAAEVQSLLRRMNVTEDSEVSISVDARRVVATLPTQASDEVLIRKWQTLNPGVSAPLHLLSSVRVD